MPHKLADEFKHDPRQLTMVLMIGYPGVGKSSFTETMILPHGYVYVNRDTLKLMKKCVDLADKSLKDGKSVVIDNTNPSREARKLFIDIAKKYKARVVVFDFIADFEIAYRLNKARKETGLGHVVPVVVFVKFRMDYQPPHKDEGISDIYMVE